MTSRRRCRGRGARLREAAGAYAADPAPPRENGNGARPELMPLIVDAVRARASVGEISDALEEVWGHYRPAA